MIIKRIIFIVAALFLLTFVLYFYRNNTKDIEKPSLKKLPATESEVKKMQISSTAFENNASIPAKFTCDGENTNPPLEISGVPDNASGLVLVVEDPDAPSKTWIHWILFNIPPQTKEIKEDSVPGDSVQGMNDFQEADYGGPCPPSGAHHYHFKLYALDKTLDLASGATLSDVTQEMAGHIIAQTELVGLYTNE
jgi:hypothetical protein